MMYSFSYWREGVRNKDTSQPCFCIAFFSNPHVILTGTIFPSFIYVSISFASSEPVAISSLRSSPAERWTSRWYSLINRAHWVPLPQPGPLSAD